MSEEYCPYCKGIVTVTEKMDDAFICPLCEKLFWENAGAYGQILRKEETYPPLREKKHRRFYLKGDTQ